MLAAIEADPTLLAAVLMVELIGGNWKCCVPLVTGALGDFNLVPGTPLECDKTLSQVQLRLKLE